MTPEKKTAVLVDFDETAAEQNVAEMLLRRFGPPDQEERRRLFRQGLLTLQEYQEQMFRQVQASPEELARFASQQAVLRPGFGDLVRYCQAEGFPIALVTHSLEFYVRAVLERHQLGAAVQVFAVKARWTPQGLQFAYPYAEPTCQGWGNCKCRILQGFRRQAQHILYVGDGRSDFCPAAKADLVFGRGPLLEHCRERGIRHHAFEDFTEVVAALREGLLR